MDIHFLSRVKYANIEEQEDIAHRNRPPHKGGKRALAYTPAEIDWMRQNQHLTIPQMVKYLGRSKSGIKNYCIKYGLTPKPERAGRPPIESK